MAHIAGIAERRVYFMLARPTRDGPRPFLAPDPGLRSGLMIFAVRRRGHGQRDRRAGGSGLGDQRADVRGIEDYNSFGRVPPRLAALDLTRRVVAIELCARRRRSCIARCDPAPAWSEPTRSCGGCAGPLARTGHRGPMSRRSHRSSSVPRLPNNGLRRHPPGWGACAPGPARVGWSAQPCTRSAACPSTAGRTRGDGPWPRW